MDEEERSFKRKDIRRTKNMKTGWIRAVVALMIPIMISGKFLLSLNVLRCNPTTSWCDNRS